jgi:mannose-6-phosphate isomerase
MNVTKKPWGMEELLEHNDKYVLKRLTMNKGYRCSLQYHEMKCETLYILSGRLKLLLGEEKDNLKTILMGPGDFLTIKNDIIHRMEAIENSIYLEASTPELDDVIRIDDDYNRK